MSIELEGKRAATKETRRILRRRIDKGLKCLEGPRISDERIHRARKQIKMARATLRLLRERLSDKEFRAENSRLRDAARPLSEVRDAAVLRRAFARIGGGSHGRDSHNEVGEVDQMLAGEQSRTHRQVAGGRGIPHARRLLQKARARTARWHLGRHGWSTLGTGLRQVYRRGRRALRTVRSKPSDVALHEWRKQVKYLRHQIQLLRPIWPGPLEALADELHALADHLGDDHDLVVLRAKLKASGSPLNHKTALRKVLRKLDRDRATLQHKALRVGMRVYEEPTALFCSRLRHYWRDWRKSRVQ